MGLLCKTGVTCSRVFSKDLEKSIFHQVSEKLNKMAKLFVYGVNARCPRVCLESEFARCGDVTDVYITEKGYAFVTMADQAAADAAIKELNGSVVDGQEIKVDNAHGGVTAVEEVAAVDLEAALLVVGAAEEDSVEDAEEEAM